MPRQGTTEGELTVSTRPHNHLSDPTAVKVSCVEKKIIALAKEQPTLTTSHLLKEWAKATISPAERSKAMLRWSMRRKIQRAKNGIHPNPALPQNYDDLDKIPDQFTKTSVVPAPFMQFYTVMAELDNKSYPCFFALLPNKWSTTYSKMLEVLKDNVEMKGPLHLKQV